MADDGKVTLDAAAQGAKVEGQAILLEATGPAAPAVAATRPVAVQWWNLADTARIVTGAGAAVEAAAGESAAVVAVPTAGPGKIVVGGLSVTEHTALAVKPRRPPGPSVVMMFTAAPRRAIASR